MTSRSGCCERYSSGSASLARSEGSSRSRYKAWGLSCSSKERARVVLPAWRGPSSATAGKCCSKSSNLALGYSWNHACNYATSSHNCNVIAEIDWRHISSFSSKTCVGGHPEMIRPKAAPSQLDPLSYESRRQQVLRRDGWRCQSCGTMSNLEVHHREFRSHSGGDSEENLITLCVDCHRRAHELR